MHKFGKDYFLNYLSSENWLIEEDVWKPEWQGVRESQFTLGNGYLGSRGVLEEIPYDAYPGTYIAGVYDRTAAQVTELVNAPNPVDFRIIVQGEKLDIKAMDVLEHKRILDMRKGLLYRRTIYSNSKKRKFDYQSLRFFSMPDKHLGVMQIYLTPQDAAATITVQSGINTNITNKGVLTEGRKKHFHINELTKTTKINYLCTQTFEKGISIAYATTLQIKGRTKRVYSTSQETFRLKVRKGQTVCFTKVFSIYTSRHLNPRRVKSTVIKHLQKNAKQGFEKLLKRHITAWSKKWKEANIEIKGDPKADRALRFNIYHLLIVGNEHDDNVSIGAKTLSGEGYRGHIFWDTEIFMLPFFIYTYPKIARNLLLYRYHRLEAARGIAEAQGFKGTLFPWESADSGEESTPSWHKDLDGSIIKIYTMERERHITSDIAYAVRNYYLATADREFMLKFGLEIMFETARFWASRVEYDHKTKLYEIKHVMGPDEFHHDVNNNTYTNAMARFNLMEAAKFFKIAKERNISTLKRIMREIKLKNSEVRQWKKIAMRLKVPIYRRGDLMEAFDGYFKRQDVPITEFDVNFMPAFPHGVNVKNVENTQLIKQADSLLLLHLLSDNFSFRQIKANYLYYERRTMHKSSLSPAIHAIIGARLGDKEKAYRYFLHSANTDLGDIHKNAEDGIHAASLGGVWQTVIFGFAGMKVQKDRLCFEPRLPLSWEELKFKIKWRGHPISVFIDKKKIQLCFASKRKKDKLKLKVYGFLRELPANERVSFYRRRKR